MEAAGLEYVMVAAWLEETYMDVADSKIILLIPSCMDSVVFNILVDDFKEALKTAFGENTEFKEILGEDIEDGKVSAVG